MIKEEFIKKLVELFDHKLTYDNKELCYRNKIKITIPETLKDISEVEPIIQNSMGIFQDNTLEVLIKSIDSIPLDNVITNSNYEIKINENISDVLCVKMIKNLPTEKIKVFVPIFRLERIYEETGNINLFDFIRAAFSEYYSLEIK